METRDFVVRPMVANDASGPLRDWLADPQIMHPMNLPARRIPIGELAAYITGFDQRSRMLLAVEDIRSGSFAGFWMITSDQTHAVASINLAIDRKNDHAPLIAIESLILVGEMLLKLGYGKTVANILESNTRARELAETVGYPFEGLLRKEVQDLVNGGERLDVLRYGLPLADFPCFRDRALEIARSVRSGLNASR